MSGRGVIDGAGAGGGGVAKDAGRGGANDGFGAGGANDGDGANDGFGAGGANDGDGANEGFGGGTCDCIFGGRGSGMSLPRAAVEPGGIADVDTRSGGDAGSVVTSGLRSSGAAIGSVPPTDGAELGAIGGRAVSPDGASGIRLVCGAALDGGGATEGAEFAGGAMPIDVCARGRMPDVARFEEAPETDCATGREDGAAGGMERGRGA